MFLSADDQLQFDARRSIATAIECLLLLAQHKRAFHQYRTRFDKVDALAVHEDLCWLLEKSLNHEVWRAPTGDVLVAWTGDDLEVAEIDRRVMERLPAVAHLAAGKLLGLSLPDHPAALEKHVLTVRTRIAAFEAPAVSRIRERMMDLFIFELDFPDPDAETPGDSGQRFVLLFGHYWDSLRAVLAQQAHAPIGFRPHPLLRLIVALQERLRRCAEAVGDPDLAAALEDALPLALDPEATDVWDEWAQPIVDRVSECFERVRLQRRPKPITLTYPERLFAQTVSDGVAELREHTGRTWNRILAGVPAPEPVLKRRTYTFVFTDIVNSTARTFELGDPAWSAIHGRYSQTIEAACQRYSPTLRKDTGDGHLVAFPSAVDALSFVADFRQAALTSADYEIRFGVATGEPEVGDGDVRGAVVNLAARLNSVAEPNGAAVAATTVNIVGTQRLFRFSEAQFADLKGFSEPVEFRRLLPPD